MSTDVITEAPAAAPRGGGTSARRRSPRWMTFTRRVSTAVLVVRSLIGIVRAFLRPVTSVISPIGWLVLLAGGGALIAAAVLGWEELFFLGATLVAAVLVSITFIFGRSTYAVAIELTPRRVVVGDRALGSMTVTNSGTKKLLGARMELPVGSSAAEFSFPPLTPGEDHEELFTVPTERRAVIVAGPARSVRGDQLGLLRRSVKWTEAIDLFVHPETTRIAPSAAGLVKDLEGQVSKTITNNDISFHALRSYVPGDDRRYVHWRTSARTGQLMVRQFEETRRSQLTIVHSSFRDYYASDTEFELAVSITASIATQVIRDGTQVSVVAEGQTLRTHTASSLLDDSCRIVPVKRRYPSARAFAHDVTKRLPTPSVVMIVAGSLMTTRDLRSIESLFPGDTTVFGVSANSGATPTVSAVSGLRVLNVGELTHLPKLLKRVNA